MSLVLSETTLVVPNALLSGAYYRRSIVALYRLLFAWSCGLSSGSSSRQVVFSLSRLVVIWSSRLVVTSSSRQVTGSCLYSHFCSSLNADTIFLQAVISVQGWGGSGHSHS